MQNSQPVRDWLTIHRELLEFETAFTDLAMQAARGELSMAELDSQRSRLLLLRELCTAAYQKAFPGAAGAGSTGRS